MDLKFKICFCVENMLKTMLTGHLRGMQKNRQKTKQTYSDNPDLMNYAAKDPKLWLGKQPASKQELKRALNDLLTVFFCGKEVDQLHEKILKLFSDPHFSELDEFGAKCGLMEK